MKLAPLAAFVALLLVLAATGVVEAAPGDEVVDLALAGKTDALAAGVSGGLWAGRPAALLASALLETDGLEAVNGFEQVAANPASTQAQKTLAQFHLYGYAVILGDRGKMNRALEGMRQDLSLAERLMGGELPEPELESWFAVQIGAFGSSANAKRLADKQSAKGYTVVVEPIRSGSRTLHAVWVGRFSSADEARDFGSRIFGREGKDFRVVEKRP